MQCWCGSVRYCDGHRLLPTTDQSRGDCEYPWLCQQNEGAAQPYGANRGKFYPTCLVAFSNPASITLAVPHSVTLATSFLSFVPTHQQQYTFIHYALLEAIAYGDTSFPLSDFPTSYEQLKEVNKETGRPLLEEEFDRLTTVRTMVLKSSFIQRVKLKGDSRKECGKCLVSLLQQIFE